MRPSVSWSPSSASLDPENSVHLVTIHDDGSEIHEIIDTDIEVKRRRNFFDAHLYSIAITPPADPTARVWLVDAEYSGEDLVITEYLETLRRPSGMEDVEFVKFKKKALGFLVRDGYLLKKGRRRGATPKPVVGTAEQRRQIMHELHDTHHRGRQATFEHVSRRYQWNGMWDDITEFVKSSMDVSDEVLGDTKNLSTRRGLVLFGKKLALMWFICHSLKKVFHSLYLPETT